MSYELNHVISPHLRCKELVINIIFVKNHDPDSHISIQYYRVYGTSHIYYCDTSPTRVYRTSIMVSPLAQYQSRQAQIDFSFSC